MWVAQSDDYLCTSASDISGLFMGMSSGQVVDAGTASVIQKVERGLVRFDQTYRVWSHATRPQTQHSCLQM